MKGGTITDLYNQIQNKTNIFSMHVREDNTVNRRLLATIVLLDKDKEFPIHLFDRETIDKNEKVKYGAVKSRGLDFERQIKTLISAREKRSSKMKETSSFFTEMAVPALVKSDKKARSIDVEIDQTSESLIFKFEGH